jgi:hypothetical protein
VNSNVPCVVLAPIILEKASDGIYRMKPESPVTHFKGFSGTRVNFFENDALSSMLLKREKYYKCKK